MIIMRQPAVYYRATQANEFQISNTNVPLHRLSFTQLHAQKTRATN